MAASKADWSAVEIFWIIERGKVTGQGCFSAREVEARFLRKFVFAKRAETRKNVSLQLFRSSLRTFGTSGARIDSHSVSMSVCHNVMGCLSPNPASSNLLDWKEDTELTASTPPSTALNLFKAQTALVFTHHPTDTRGWFAFQFSTVGGFGALRGTAPTWNRGFIGPGVRTHVIIQLLPMIRHSRFTRGWSKAQSRNDYLPLDFTPLDQLRPPMHLLSLLRLLAPRSRPKAARNLFLSLGTVVRFRKSNKPFV